MHRKGSRVIITQSNWEGTGTGKGGIPRLILHISVSF